MKNQKNKTKTQKDILAEHWNGLNEIQDIYRVILFNEIKYPKDTEYLKYRKYSKRKDLSSLIIYGERFYGLKFPDYGYDKNGILEIR